MFIGAGIIMWDLVRNPWFDVVFNGILFALPCLVFGYEQRRKYHFCPMCMGKPDDAS